MKVRKVIPEPYALLTDENGQEFRVYKDGRVLTWLDAMDDFVHYPTWEEDYEVILNAGLAVL